MEYYNIRALVMRERTRCVHFKCWAGCGLRQSYYLESYTSSVVMVDPRDTGAHQCTHVCAHYIGLGQHHHTVCDLLLRPPTLPDGIILFSTPVQLRKQNMLRNQHSWY